MFNVEEYAQRLLSRLIESGFQRHEASEICEGFRNAVRYEVDAILTESMSDLVDEGIKKNLKDFAKEVTAYRLGDSYVIATDSGRTDFSVPPFPMLPKLLKNAKIAKDGSRYKVIPVRSTADTMRSINSNNISRSRHTDVKFRTASSKQDASTQWVNPGVEGDMRDAIQAVNMDFERRVSEAIQEIASIYERIL